MAPEMFIAPDSISGSVDIYAFGVTLYEMLTGGRPFDAAVPEDIVAAHIDKVPIDPRRLNPAIPAELAALTLQCLAKQAADRPSGFDEIYEGLISHMGDSLRQREQLIASLANAVDEAVDLVHRAVSLDNMDDSRRALDLLNRALSLDSDLPTAWHSKGVVLYRLSRWQESLECTERAIGLLQLDDAQKYLLALCLMIKGHTLSRLGRDDDSRVAYESAAAMHQDIKEQLRAAGVL